MWHILSIFYQNPHIRYIYICSIYIYVKYIYIYIAYILFISYILYIYVYIYTPHIHSILHKDYQRNHSSSNNRLGCWENHPSPPTRGGNHLAGRGGVWGSLLIYIHIAVSVSVSWGVQLLKNTHTVPDPGWNWVDAFLAIRASQLWLVHTIGKPVPNIIAGHFTPSQTRDIPNFMSLHWERFIIGFTTWLFLILNYLSKCQQQHFVAVLHVFLIFLN